MARSPQESQLVELKDTIRELNKTIKSQNLLIETLQKSKEEQENEFLQQIKNLQEQVDFLTKKLFGKSSEKTQIPGQINLFDEAENEYQKEAAKVPKTVVKEHTRKKRSSHDEIFKGVPQRDELIELPENERICSECGAELEVIGKEFVRHEFRYTPATGELVNIYRATYKCPECSTAPELETNLKFIKAHVPKSLIPHSYTSESAVAWTMYQKFHNAMPLYRQEKDWLQLGAKLTRGTLAQWIIFCAETYFRPLYQYFHKMLLKRKFLMADETRVQVLKEPERAAETNSFMWLFRTGEDGEPAIILYHYTQTRKRENALNFLKGFSGYLETDAYQGYNNLPNVRRCYCWAHVRRAFIDAVPKGKEYDYSNPAVQGVQFCSKLFEYEQIAKERNYSFEHRKEYRIKKEFPVIEAFWEWIDQQHPRKGSRLEKAVNYALNQKEGLMTYLEDGRCSLSNNLSENGIRPFAVGRKNWLFADTPEGAESSSICYTMVEMAKAHGLKVYPYLEYVLRQRPLEGLDDDFFEKISPWSSTIPEEIKESH